MVKIMNKSKSKMPSFREHRKSLEVNYRNQKLYISIQEILEFSTIF